MTKKKIPTCPVSAPKKPRPKKKPTGRPSTYTPELSETICERLSLGESLRAICRTPGMPPQATLFRWLAAHAAFREQYSRARALQTEYFLEEILRESQDRSRDFYVDGNGNKVPNHAAVARSALISRNTMWVMSRMAPKRYGEKPEIAVEPENVVTRIQRTIIDSLPLVQDAPTTAPLRQLSFDPGPLPAALDPEILQRLVMALKENVPKAKDVDPRTLLNEAMDVIRRALRVHFKAA